MYKKTVIVTGGSRGIGEAIVRLFSLKGYNVVFTYNKSKEASENIVKSIRESGAEIDALSYNASKEEDAVSLISFALKKYSKVDVLVNNAGISYRELITDTSDINLKQVFDTNLFGMFSLCKEAVKSMIDKKDGCIINIASVYGIIGASMETAYSAAKAGVIGLSKALSQELAPSNIAVNCIAPGVIETDMNSWLSKEEREDLSLSIPLGRFGTPAEVAAATLFLAECRGITGQVLFVDGGLTWQSKIECP